MLQDKFGQGLNIFKHRKRDFLKCSRDFWSLNGVRTVLVHRTREFLNGWRNLCCSELTENLCEAFLQQTSPRLICKVFLMNTIHENHLPKSSETRGKANPCPQLRVRFPQCGVLGFIFVHSIGKQCCRRRYKYCKYNNIVIGCRQEPPYTSTLPQYTFY